MFYSIRHVTRFRYSAPVRESVMELRMQPRSEGPQALRSFQITTNPRAQLYAYTDHRRQRGLSFQCLARASKNCASRHKPSWRSRAWRQCPTRRICSNGSATTATISATTISICSSLRDSRVCSPALLKFIAESGLEKPTGDPLTRAEAAEHDHSTMPSNMKPGVTEVHSPIDHALKERRGVCQDFAHIMIAVARQLGHPGALCLGLSASSPARPGPLRRRTRPMPGWKPICRAWAGSASIRPTIWPRTSAISAPRWAAIMPTCRRRAAPSRAIAESELAIAVAVEPTQAPVRHEDFLRVARPMSSPQPTASVPERLYHQQQQQQQ